MAASRKDITARIVPLHLAAAVVQRTSRWLWPLGLEARARVRLLLKPVPVGERHNSCRYSFSIRGLVSSRHSPLSISFYIHDADK